MEKDKLVLKNGTEITLEDSRGIEKMYVVVENKEAVVTLWEQLTPENLKEIQITNADGEATGNYADMLLVSITCVEGENGAITVEINLRAKTELELLREEMAVIKAAQQTADVAIGDLGEVVAVLAEGGME